LPEFQRGAQPWLWATLPSEVRERVHETVDTLIPWHWEEGYIWWWRGRGRGWH
jgi:hypothetical protein